MEPISTRGFSLRRFQADAVDAWVAGSANGPMTGTIAVVTGGGKTLIALSCIQRACEQAPDLRAAVVVPTVALAEQWLEVIPRFTTLAPDEVGLLGGSGDGDLSRHRVVVSVLNTAAKILPAMASRHQPMMLIVDECHRAGAPTFSNVLRTPARYRLGLSATPDREELDDDGEPLDYDEQLVGESLGGVVYAFTLADARAGGWLPDYTIHHHGISLLEGERARYDAVSRRVDDAADQLRGLGGDTGRGRQLAQRRDEVGEAARSYVAATAERKDLLYRAEERARVAAEILRAALSDPASTSRAILFHERIDEAEALFQRLRQGLPGIPIAVENSRMRPVERRAAVADFSSGAVRMLVSVKSLIEGIDVPEADIGVSVASTSSVRQRIQSLGRVLRRSDDPEKRAAMHLIYVADTVDDVIYGKADWSDLTGKGVNQYWRWPAEEGPPQREPGPPRTPLPTEEQIHERAEELLPSFPAAWPGEVAGQEYSASTAGTVHNAFDRLIANPQGVSEMIAGLRGRPGGRFRVTPAHRYVLVWERTAEGPQAFVVGQLLEPFEVVSESVLSDARPASIGKPQQAGEVFRGSTDKGKGTYRLSQRAGGLIERSAPGGGKESALVSGTAFKDKERNAEALIAAWNRLGRPAARCFVNGDWEAWCERGGERIFLADVPGGFVWPTDLEGR